MSVSPLNLNIQNIPPNNRYSQPPKHDASFLESQINRKSLNKTEFAIQCAPHLTLDNMKPRFDWEEQMKQIVTRIEAWNA